MNLTCPFSLLSPWRALVGLCLSWCLLLGAMPLAHAHIDWEPHGTSNGITIFTRHVPGQALKEFRGIVQVDAPLAQVAATLADVSTMHEWFFLLDEARFIKGERLDDAYIYLALKGIWPVNPRDAVAHVTVKQDPASMAITVNVVSQDGLMGPQKGYVRVPTLKSTWTLRVISPTRTEVEVEGHGDPGGWIPTAIANFVVTTLPRQSLAKMREHVAKPEYRDLKKMYARNPQLRELGERLVFPTPLP